MIGNRRGRPPMRGSSRLSPRTPLPEAVPMASRPPVDAVHETSTPVRTKKRVVFVCIGNSCRSQMAEAFARAYGSDIIEASSAGVSPAADIAPLTRKVVYEKNVGMEGQFPKGLEVVVQKDADMIVNMSGLPLTARAVRMVTWRVPDPIGNSEMVFRKVADEIEQMVMRLILELRSSTL